VHRALKIGRKWLYIVHRWIGVASCLLITVWFLSGLVMMYVPYPSLTEAERLQAQAPIDWNAVRVAPDAAMRTAGVAAFPSRLRLEMMAGEPVYRIVGDTGRNTVSARDGRLVEGVDATTAERIGAAFARAPIWRSETVDRDQWTVAGGFDVHRPLHRLTVEDRAGTTLYVSSITGEVVQATTARERFWNWLGAIPHWIYFTSLRTDTPLWRQVIMWTSGVGLVGAVTGLWIGLLRLHLKKRYHHLGAKRTTVTPYRGWMKWHHIGGLVTGLTLTTWVFSGWLSVNPFDWFARTSPDPAALVRYAGSDAPHFPANLGRIGVATRGAREARFVWVAGRPLVVTSAAGNERRVLDGRTGAPARFTPAALTENARTLMPETPLDSAALLTGEDIYWYGHHGQVRLPVLRVRFTDEANTWFHIDVATGEVLGALDDSGRGERWLFNFLHDFDLPVLLQHRPLWDVVVWPLMLGGLLISVSGVVIGWRRLVRTLRRRPRRLQPAEARLISS
jgi:uncharacterized membrane protein